MLFAELIDGKAIAETIRGELKAEVDQLQQQYGKVRRRTVAKNMLKDVQMKSHPPAPR